MLDVRALRLRPHLSLTFVTALALAAAILGGCGGDSSGSGRKLSPATSASLEGTLDKLQADVSAGNCTDAAQEAATLRQQIDAVPRAGRALRRALASSAARLESLVADQCKPTSTTPPAESQGSTGATGEKGTTGEQNGEGKKEKKPKQPKKEKQGQNDGGPPRPEGGGGGSGPLDETNPDGVLQP